MTMDATTTSPTDRSIRAALRASRARTAARWFAVIAFTLGLAYLVALPPIRLQQLAFENELLGFRRALNQPRIGRTLITTVFLALGSLMIALVLGTWLGWAATRLPRRLGFMRAVPILPIVVPAVAAVTGWSFLFSPRPGYANALLRKLPWWNHLTEGPVDVYTLPWIIIITGFGLTSFVYLFVNSGFANINSELIEAAQVSGSTGLGVFFKVTLPLLRPMLVYGGGVALLLGLGQFTGPLLLGTNAGIRVLTTDMYFAAAQIPIDYATAAALGTPLLLFGIAVVVLQRVVLGDRTRFITHGGKGGFKQSSRPSWLAAGSLGLFGLVSTLLPLLALAFVATSRFWTPEIDLSRLTLDNFRHVLDSGNVTQAIRTSLIASITAVVIVIPVGYIAASLLLRGRQFGWVRGAIDFIVSLPLGVPSVVFGVGFLLAYTQEPLVLYGTRWVIILVYITLMLPFATRMQLSGMISLGDAYIEASRVCGARMIRTNLQIIVPLLRGTTAGAAALMFVLLTHEFSASLLVRSPTTQVMGTALYDQWVSGSYPTVAAIAIIMTGVTAVGVSIAVTLGGRDVFEKL